MTRLGPQPDCLNIRRWREQTSRSFRGRPFLVESRCGAVALGSGERLHLAPQDILFVFHEVEPNLPRFPAASIGERRPRLVPGSSDLSLIRSRAAEVDGR